MKPEIIAEHFFGYVGVVGVDKHGNARAAEPSELVGDKRIRFIAHDKEGAKLIVESEINGEISAAKDLFIKL